MKEVKQLQQKYKDGEISRRDFVKAVGALGISATAAGGLLTSAQALAATPRKGGTARYATGSKLRKCSP